MSDNVAEIAAALAAISAAIGGVFGYRKMGGKVEDEPKAKPDRPGYHTTRLETQREKFERLRNEVDKLGQRVDEIAATVAVIKDRTERDH